MEVVDDNLEYFAECGALPLPPVSYQGYIHQKGISLWYALYGAGTPVILLHGGLGHSGNWAYQLPGLVAAGHCVVLIDSRGHGRSSWDGRPFGYDLLAADVLAVMDALLLDQVTLVGWSDGACTALVLASQVPSRVAGVFFFGCNMDPSGLREVAWPHPLLDRCLARHAKDYACLSSTPHAFDTLRGAVSLMQRTEPTYSPVELGTIQTRVAIVQAEHDEFIKAEHAHYLSQTIPNAELIVLPGVSHFAPLQRPAQFCRVLETFLDRLSG